jgi:putative ABC transport system permease protein
VNFPAHAFTSPLARRLFSDQAVARLSATPGVDLATMTAGVPPSSGQTSFGKIALDGQPPSSRGFVLPGYIVRPDFFAVTGIPIALGRPFATNESPESVIVSQSFAGTMWPGTSPLGHRYRLGDGDSWKQVVGVAGEVRSKGLDDSRTPFAIYYPYPRPALDTVSATPETTTGPYSGHATFLVHTVNATAAIPAIRAAILKVDSRILVDKVDTVESLYQDTMAEPRMLLVLMAVFSAAGLLVAGIGVYGVLSKLVAQQLREIGVRLMLGAEPSAMAWRVFRGGLTLAGLGVALGLVAAALASRILGSILFDVRGTDMGSYAVVAAVIGVATIAAAWLPARRAAHVDPAALVRET